MTVTSEIAGAPTAVGHRSTQLAFDPPSSRQEEPTGFSLFGEDGFGFTDLLDVVNPLQHLPFVSTLYREATDDTIAAVPRVAGATFFFGPIGLVGALANVMIEANTGKDMGAHVADWIAPEDNNAPAAPGTDATANAVGTTTSETYRPDDPVTAWARQELAWVHAPAARQAPLPVDGVGKTAVPDAAPLLREGPAPAPRDMAVLSEDAGAAAAAYAAVAAWSRPAA